METEMEIIILGLMIFSLIIIMAIDTTQKRRKFIEKANRSG